MKTVLFVNLQYYDNQPGSGVIKKLLAQAESLNFVGMPCQLAFLARKGAVLPSTSTVVNHVMVEAKMDNHGPIARPFDVFRFNRSLNCFVDGLGDDDALIIRYPYPAIVPPKSLLRAFRKCKVVYELNSIYDKEARAIEEDGLNYLKFQEAMLQRILLSEADGAIGVTEEILDYYRAAGLRKEVPQVTLGNGVDVERLPLRTPPPFQDRRLKLLAVANVSRWHGYDRIIEGISRYVGDWNFEMHVVGSGPEIVNLKSLASRLDLTGVVYFHPFSSGLELDEYFDHCHLGVSSLGLHRKGLNQASALKAREYCARGLPFMDSTDDKDFSEHFNFRLHISASESPIDMEEVVSFAQRVLSSDQHALQMREFAMKKLDFKVKMRQMAAFIRSL